MLKGMHLRAAAVGIASCTAVIGVAQASSHREAPAISKLQFADNTDTYAFVSPSNDNNVVLAASWIPFQAPDGGPNYFEWDDSLKYYIHIDNNGDAIPDISYRLTSTTTVANDQTFLYNVGPIDSNSDANWNRYQTITVDEIVNGGATTTLVNDQRTSPVNIGGKSTPDYKKLFEEAVHTTTAGSDEIKVFGGQTDDAFFVDLQVFDLLTLRGQASPIGYDDAGNMPVDSLAGFNVHSLVIEVPTSRVTAGEEPVIGVWSTTEDADGTQVSRLGMPLVNELVLPLALKDTFNGLKPEQDLGAYSALQEFVENPLVGRLLCGLEGYGVPMPEDPNNDCNTEFTDPGTGRGDIFQIFLTGMKLANEFEINTAGGKAPLGAGFNVNQPANVQPADMLRLNTAIKGATCAPSPSSLGVLGGDACGFPNGRRLADDIVDIALIAVAGAGYQVLDGDDTSFSYDSGFTKVLTDGLNSNDKAFSDEFPYMAMPHSGKQRMYQNPASDAVVSNRDGGGAFNLPAVLIYALAAFAMFRRRNQG